MTDDNIKLFEKRICKKSLYKGKAVGFNSDTVLLPNGKKAVREYLVHPGAVAVLPVLENGKVVMVRQYRYPINEQTLEIPAGKMHGSKDNIIKRLRAELKEETGFTCGKLTKILSFWPCSTFSNEHLHIYLAEKLKQGKAMPDEDEFLRVEIVPLDKAFKMVDDGKIKDAKTVIALLWYRLHKYKLQA